jgi:hypothetical protein
MNFIKFVFVIVISISFPWWTTCQDGPPYTIYIYMCIWVEILIGNFHLFILKPLKLNYITKKIHVLNFVHIKKIMLCVLCDYYLIKKIIQEPYCIRIFNSYRDFKEFIIIFSLKKTLLPSSSFNLNNKQISFSLDLLNNWGIYISFSINLSYFLYISLHTNINLNINPRGPSFEPR